jgi:light-regulated signal transduction histidine kinase (bacteriophytochrome)
VTNILEAAKKMGALIDDLLAFSRIGRAETRMTLVSLGELQREVLREMERETVGRDIAWKAGTNLPSVHGARCSVRRMYRSSSFPECSARSWRSKPSSSAPRTTC